jgi:hypothetical protein
MLGRGLGSRLMAAPAESEQGRYLSLIDSESAASMSP